MEFRDVSDRTKAMVVSVGKHGERMEVGLAHHTYSGHPTEFVFDTDADVTRAVVEEIKASPPRARLWYRKLPEMSYLGAYELLRLENHNCMLWGQLFDGRCPWSGGALEKADVLAVRLRGAAGGRSALLAVATDAIEAWTQRPITTANAVISDG